MDQRHLIICNFIEDLQRLAIIARALADIAWHVYIGQELHLDTILALSLTRLAAAAFDIEAETTRRITAYFALGHIAEQVANLVEQVGIGRRVAARRAADRTLIDLDHFVQMLQSVNRLVLAGEGLRAIEVLAQSLAEDLDQERTLAAAADAGNADELAQRDADVHIFQIVLGRADDLQPFAGAGPALFRHGPMAGKPKSAEMHPGPGFRIREEIARPDPATVEGLGEFDSPAISDLMNRLDRQRVVVGPGWVVARSRPRDLRHRPLHHHHRHPDGDRLVQDEAREKRVNGGSREHAPRFLHVPGLRQRGFSPPQKFIKFWLFIQLI